jgi:hypothetical protein
MARSILMDRGRSQSAVKGSRPSQPRFNCRGVVDSRAGTVQLADGHYKPGFKWIEDLPKATTAIKEADRPVLKPRVEPAAGQLRTAAPRPAKETRQPPEPFRSLIEVVMLPFDFLSYPGRRDW